MSPGSHGPLRPRIRRTEQRRPRARRQRSGDVQWTGVAGDHQRARARARPDPAAPSAAPPLRHRPRPRDRPLRKPSSPGPHNTTASGRCVRAGRARPPPNRSAGQRLFGHAAPGLTRANGAMGRDESATCSDRDVVERKLERVGGRARPRRPSRRFFWITCWPRHAEPLRCRTSAAARSRSARTIESDHALRARQARERRRFDQPLEIDGGVVAPRLQFTRGREPAPRRAIGQHDRCRSEQGTRPRKSRCTAIHEPVDLGRGDARRIAATAGSVCTEIAERTQTDDRAAGSHSAPGRARRPAGASRFARGVILRIADDRDAAAVRPHDVAFGHGVDRVVRALAVHVRPDSRSSRSTGQLAERHHVVDAAQARRRARRDRARRHDRPIGALQRRDRLRRRSRRR